MEQVSDRHSGELNGMLEPFDPAKAVTVRVIIDDTTAAAPAVQHTAWMLLNLLARAEGIVSRLLISGGEETAVVTGVIPFGEIRTLEARLFEAVNAIGVVPATIDNEQLAERTLIVGWEHNSSALTNASWVLGAGWWGGFCRTQAAPIHWETANLNHTVPYGPYLAASFAAADVFLTVRDPRSRHRNRTTTYGYDAWNDVQASAPTDLGPEVPRLDISNVALAGVGAVGAAWMHAIWATPGITGTVVIADSDAEGVSASNLNRGLLFTRANVGQGKAAAAAAATVGQVSWAPIFQRFEEAGLAPSVLISAVDTNRSRDALQAGYPARILSGSTRDLRAEVTTVGVPGIGACLRCFNPPEEMTSDAEIRTRVVTDSQCDSTLAEIANKMHTSAEELRRRIDTAACDMVTDRMMEMLRDLYGDAETSPRFAVGFTSCTAGALLAAATVKLLSGKEADIDGASRRLSIQFHRPASEINRVRPYARDAKCPRCAPTSPAVRIWETRYFGWSR